MKSEEAFFSWKIRSVLERKGVELGYAFESGFANFLGGNLILNLERLESLLREEIWKWDI